MREFDVKVKMINNDEWILPFSFFNTAGITDRAEAVIGNAIRGTNSPVFQAYKENATADDAKKTYFIAARNIVSFEVKYK